jgi:hypothetical protein
MVVLSRCLVSIDRWEWQNSPASVLEMFDGQERPNAARFVDVVATLRSAAGRNPYDRDLTDLVGELSTRSRSATSSSTTSAWKLSSTRV